VVLGKARTCEVVIPSKAKALHQSKICHPARSEGSLYQRRPIILDEWKDYPLPCARLRRLNHLITPLISPLTHVIPIPSVSEGGGTLRPPPVSLLQKGTRISQQAHSQDSVLGKARLQSCRSQPIALRF